MPYSIEDIEDAIVAALAASDLADTCSPIDHYSGSIDDLVEQMKKSPPRKPAIFVLYLGSQFHQPANRSYDDEQFFAVIAVSRDHRGADARRSGVYALLEIIKATLIDNELGLDNIEPIEPVEIEIVEIAERLSMYSFVCKTRFSIT